jgi:2-phospho-L-lactate guanylyltransferase (CobY/MobA/RfbA family)
MAASTHHAGQATGKPCVVLSLPGIALDVDNPSDLSALAAAPGETHAQRLIRQWDLADLPLAANE